MPSRVSLLIWLVCSPILGQEIEPPVSLFQAIEKGNTAAVKRLLGSGISAKAQSVDGIPALMTAVLYAGSDCVWLLLEHGADPNARNTAGETALLWAIPDVAKVKLLLDAGADVNARSTGLGRTPLLIAASYPGTVPLLELLLDHGADIHAKDRRGMHALGRAAVSADIDVVRFLVEHGCDPNEPGYGSDVRYARQYRPTLDYLASLGGKTEREVLADSANWQDAKLIENWIESGADVNAATGRYRRTALMTAASSEQAGVALVNLLLKKGADPNEESTEGERPLDWAIYANDLSKIEALEKAGATRGHGPRRQIYPPPEAGGIADPRVSIERAVNLVLPTGPALYKNRGCISCHSQALVAMAAAAARKKGIRIHEELEQTNLEQIVSFHQRFADSAMQGDQPGGNIIAIGYSMMALDAEQHPFDKGTATLNHLAAALQMPDGSWTPNGVSRPPEEDSLVTATAMGVRSLTLYPITANRDDLEARLRRAQRWLLAAEPRNTEELAMRLMGLIWSKAPRMSVETGIQELIEQQQANGGWSQDARFPPDAYATGISLYALWTAGMSPTDEVYRKGVKYLLNNQYQNGAWLVKTRSFPLQPYFESGYPFGANQWISTAGASWAALAIARTLPDAPPSRSTGK